MTRVELQLFWLRIHRWIGLSLLLVFFALALTGSVLTFPDFFERLANPERFPDRSAHSAPVRSSPLSQVVESASAHLPEGDHLSALRFPASAGGSIMAAGQVIGPPNMGLGPPRRAKVWVDPADAQVLSTHDGTADFMWSMHATHGHLLLRGVGKQVVAWMGVILLVSAGTGLWLWWPGLRHIGRALRWQRHASVNLNLHRQSGAIVVLILLLETLTGIYVAVPRFFASMIEPATQSSERSEGPSRATSLVSPGLDIDEVLRSARALVPDAPLESIFLPTGKLPEWAVNFGGETAQVVRVAELDGAARLLPRGPPGRADRVEAVMTDIHFGHYGLLWQWTVFFSGVILALLSITGLVIWWQGRQRRKHRA